MPSKCPLKLSQEAMQSAANSTVRRRKLEGIGRLRGSVPGHACEAQSLAARTSGNQSAFIIGIPALTLARRSVGCRTGSLQQWLPQSRRYKLGPTALQSDKALQSVS